MYKYTAIEEIVSEPRVKELIPQFFQLELILSSNFIDCSCNHRGLDWREFSI